MAYIALYRQWRPGSFKDLVGQTAVSRTLSHAISAGRIAHAYLFSGPRGTGKTSTAKILAKSLNCEKGPTPEPCGVCKNCTKIADGTALDVFEIDAASNRGIDEMRDLREKVKFTPAEGRYKVYIIDEVHMLTTEAFNALLKTLEEPPAHVVFILATTEPHKVPATIQSRCQRFDFRRITVEEIEARLAYVAQEMKIPCEKEALRLIARQADGGMRDALSLLDQCASLDGDTLTAACVEENLGLIGHEPIYRLTKAIGERAKSEVLETIAELLALGKDPMQLLAELTLHLRSLMIYEAAGAIAALNLADDTGAALEEQKALFTQAQIMAMIARLHEAMAELRWTPQPRITLEVALLSLCSASMEDGAKSAAAAQSSPAPAEAARIARLEAELAALKAQLSAQPARAAAPAASPLPTARRRAASHTNELASSGMPAHDSAPLVSSVPAAQAAPNPEGEKIYAELLSRLQEKQRISVLACLKGASFVGSGAGTFRLHFSSPLLARRTMRDDYRKIIEELLAEIAGTPLAISCEAQAAPPAAPPPAPKKKSPLAALDEIEPRGLSPKPLEIDENELSPEERSRLQNAVSLLGGHLVDLPEEQRIAALAASGKAVAKSVAETAEGKDAPPLDDAPVPDDISLPDDAPVPDDVPLPDDDDAPPPEENS